MKDKVMCPLVDAHIEDIECIENCDCIDGVMKLSSLPEKFQAKPNFKEMCSQCKNRSNF